MASNTLVYRRLYRSLLKASKPFTYPSPNATVLSCLLHRTGIDDGLDWSSFSAIQEETAKNEWIEPNKEGTVRTTTTRPQKSLEEARDLSKSYAATTMQDENHGNNNNKSINISNDTVNDALKKMLAQRKEPHRVMFRRLLREVVAGKPYGLRQMQFPHHVVADTVDDAAATNKDEDITKKNNSNSNNNRLREVIRREFRSIESVFDLTTRKQVGFVALRELNKKLSRAEMLEEKNNLGILSETDIERRHRAQAAKYVSPLPLDPKEYLRPGSFLLAHPLLSGYFRRTVVCILDHSERSSSSEGGTYGLVVNKRDDHQTLSDVLRTVPPPLAESFGTCAVRDGGPVHMSLQMIHAAETSQLAGGIVLSMLTDGETSAAMRTDRAIYYQGDILQAADAVKSGALDRNDVCFYAGASCWEVRQLESEVERGFWIPCRGPPEISLTGTCEHEDDDKSSKPKDDLWLSMMSAMGKEEAALAYLVHDDEDVEFGEPCDSF